MVLTGCSSGNFSSNVVITGSKTVEITAKHGEFAVQFSEYDI